MRSAIIDIGSNAIRAAVYERNALGAPEIYNDKFRSDLLTLLDSPSLDIKHQTYLSLDYFLHIFQNLQVTNITCVATAVLRGHVRAEEFVKIIYRKFGIKIDLITGEREAYLTAEGLICGINDANGLVADLGGGSLELAEINNKTVGKLKSLPLGTKFINENDPNILEFLTNTIRAEFGNIEYKNLYFIGGAFRLIGRNYMEFIDYPLKNLHNLEISSDILTVYLEKLERLYTIKSKYHQRKINYNALIVALAILKVFRPIKIRISNYGLKEGVRFVSLSDDEQIKNTILERTKALINFDANICKLHNYIEVISPLLVKLNNSTEEIIELSFILAQFNKNIDKTLRAAYAVEFILASDIPFSHTQRVMLALSLSFAYSSKSDLYINKIAKKMLSKNDYYNSQIIGNFIRLSREVDGPEFKKPSFTLLLKDKYIEIITDKILPRAVFEKVCERLRDIAFARKNIFLTIDNLI